MKNDPKVRTREGRVFPVGFLMSLTDLISTLRRAARGASDLQDIELSVANAAVLLKITNGLQEVLMPALCGLRLRTTEKPKLTISAWSGSDPVPELRKSFARYPDKISVVNEGTVHLQFNPEGDILSCLDTASGEAFYHVLDPASLPDYEICTPMRMLFNWHCDSVGCSMVHAAAVGVDGVGALIVGRSGAGKSTTALQCLLGGLQYLGDDYVGIDRNDSGIAYHLYRGCKVMDDAFDRLPSLRTRVIVRNPDRKKSVVILDEGAGNLVSKLRIAAIVRPKIANAASSSFATLSPLKATTEFAASTIMQMPGVGEFMLRDITALCKRLPAFEMALSGDPSEIARALHGFIDRLSRQ